MFGGVVPIHHVGVLVSADGGHGHVQAFQSGRVGYSVYGLFDTFVLFMVHPIPVRSFPNIPQLVSYRVLGFIAFDSFT